jgi:ribonuclease HI
MAKIVIYTDGSSRGNPGPGGWGSILICGSNRKEISGGFKFTTNNRMELMSVIYALEALKTNGHDITIYSDSQYVVNSVEKGWVFNWIKNNKKDAKNMDLWQKFVSLYPLNNIKFIWVKGHSSNVENNCCDVLATTAAQSSNLPDDTGYKKSK